MIKYGMKKMQTDTTWETAKISNLLSGKIDQHEYQLAKKILPPQQHRII